MFRVLAFRLSRVKLRDCGVQVRGENCPVAPMYSSDRVFPLTWDRDHLFTELAV